MCEAHIRSAANIVAIPGIAAVGHKCCIEAMDFGVLESTKIHSACQFIEMNSSRHQSHRSGYSFAILISALSFAVMNLIIAAELSLSRKNALGILDFRYAPYALADTFTWLTNVQIKAHLHGHKSIDLVLISLPEKRARRHQPYVTSYNQVQVMEGLLPAFLTCPSVNSLRIFQSKNKVSQRILGAVLTHAA